MARKKQTEKPKKNTIPNAYIAGAGVVEEEKITDTPKFWSSPLPRRWKSTLCPMR